MRKPKSLQSKSEDAYVEGILQKINDLPSESSEAVLEKLVFQILYRNSKLFFEVDKMHEKIVRKKTRKLLFDVRKYVGVTPRMDYEYYPPKRDPDHVHYPRDYKGSYYVMAIMGGEKEEDERFFIILEASIDFPERYAFEYEDTRLHRIYKVAFSKSELPKILKTLRKIIDKDMSIEGFLTIPWVGPRIKVY